MTSQSDKIKEVMNKVNWKPNSIIVYDIDGTLIDFLDNPIQEIIDTYQYAVQKQLKIVIITARPGTYENIQRTQEQLAKHGINKYIRMYFLPLNKINKFGTGDEVQSRFKLQARKYLHSLGFNVEMSIGDMPWDIGQFGGIGFRV
jgi:hypothetical protein